MKKSSNISRRDFMLCGSVAATGNVLYASNSGKADSSQASPPHRPFVTCKKGIKLVGVYCSPDEVMNHPEYLDALQKKIGCNVILLNGCGVNYPEDIRKLAPYAPETNQWIGPVYSENDENIHLCADIVHDRGMDMWLVGSGHYDRGNDDSLSPVDFNGMLLRHHPVPKYAIEGGTGLCFQKPLIMQWQANAYPWISRNYDIDALYLSHHRYNIPSFYTHLYGCGCGYCQRAAERLGYDYKRMRSAMLKLRSSLQTLTKDQVRLAAELGYTFPDFLQTLTDGTDVMDWFEFRSAAFTDSFGSVNNAIRTTTKGRCKFIIDTVGPTFMFLVGHDYKDFVGKVSDAYYPMAWIDYHYLSVIASWANALIECVPGLDERTALSAVYNLVGWDDIDLPREHIADLHIGITGKEHSIPEFYKYFKKFLKGLMVHEYRRGALLNTHGYPSYQTVFPHYWGGKVTEPLIDEIMATGHNGYIFEISAEPFVKKPN
ncbi:hypothetical protein ACFL1R_11990 [Candidatus Latescibacterota bacterium]